MAELVEYLPNMSKDLPSPALQSPGVVHALNPRAKKVGTGGSKIQVRLGMVEHYLKEVGKSL